MEHPFPYADDNKRYHTLAYHLKKRFGRRVFKASIDAGFTCPNLDGTWVPAAVPIARVEAVHLHQGRRSPFPIRYGRSRPVSI